MDKGSGTRRQAGAASAADNFSMCTRLPVLALLTILLCACGGGGSSGSAPRPVTGAAVNGPLDGASVSIYATDGRLLAQTTTDHSGRYSALVAQPPPYRIEVHGGLLDGERYGGVLHAPCSTRSACNITPYTTAVERLMAAQALSEAQARAQLTRELGFEYDPFVHALIEGEPTPEFDLAAARTFIDGGTALEGWVDAVVAYSDPAVADAPAPAGVSGQYQVNASAGAGGSIAPASVTLARGDSASFRLSPDSGYSIDSVSGCEGTLAGDTYTTAAIRTGCTVQASFARRVYAVSTDAGSGGRIDAASTEVAHGERVTLTLSPDSGYRVAAVSGCGGSLSGDSYTTAPVTAACTVAATFAPLAYTVTGAAGSGGSIAPASTLVAHGERARLTLAPAASHHVAAATGCGGSLAGTVYTTAPVTAACTVNASFALNRYSVTANASAGGAISPVSSSVDHGSSASFALTPDPGYHIDSVSGCGGTLSGTTYTTGPVTASCTISATFSLNSYTVDASAGSGGTISPSSRNIDHGSTTSFTVTPDAGYGIASVSGCGGSLSGNTYTTGPITAACSIDASFAVSSHSVTASAGTGGTAAPALQDIAHGDTATVSVTPATGYAVDSVSGCSGSLSGNTYTTAAVTADCSISASFKPLHYTVGTSASSGGTVAPASAEVDYGTSANFTLSPAAGYHLDSVSGCGGSLSGSTYSTGAVTADCTVSANFALNQYTVSANAGSGGTISPASSSVLHGQTASFTLAPASGYAIASASGCGGSLSGTTYTTGPVTADCSIGASFSVTLEAPTVTRAVSDQPTEALLQWDPVADADGYNVYYATDPNLDPANYASYGGTKAADLSTTSYRATGLSSDTTYYFAVGATAGSLEGPTSPLTPVTTLAPGPTCYGTPSWDATVCGGHGTCVANNQCRCNGLYSGNECQVTLKFSTGQTSYTFPTNIGRYSIIDGPDLPVSGSRYIWKMEIVETGYWPGRDGFTFGIAGYPLQDTTFHEVGLGPYEWSFRGQDGSKYSFGGFQAFGSPLKNVGDQIMLEYFTETGVLNVYTKRVGASSFSLEGGQSIFTGALPSSGQIIRPAVSAWCLTVCTVKFIE